MATPSEGAGVGIRGTRDRVGSGTPPSQGPFTDIVSYYYEAGEPGRLCDGCVAAWMTAFVIDCDLNELIKALRAAMEEAEIS
jgi:hypothetical protein